MSLPEKYIEILAELARTRDMPGYELDGIGTFPRLIATGMGGSIFVTETIDRLIQEIGTTLFSEKCGDGGSRESRYTLAEWLKAVRSAFGPILATADLNACDITSARAALEKLRTVLAARERVPRRVTYCYGTTLFQRDVAPFDIGPVRFETRGSWLQRMRDERKIAPELAAALLNSWSCEEDPGEAETASSHQVRAILKSIGPCHYVCSVECVGLAEEVAREKTLLAARLALTSIALWWQQPSRTLEAMNLYFDRERRQRSYLAFGEGPLSSGSDWSPTGRGPEISPPEWACILADWGDLIDVAGKVLQLVVEPDALLPQKVVLNALMHSLLAFYQGCRESLPVLATVHFAASLDALSGGKKEKGIKELITARLGFEQNDSLYTQEDDRWTMGSAVNRIYGAGRSRTLHGTNDQLLHDWSLERGCAEQLARLCLQECIQLIAQSPEIVGVGQLSERRGDSA